MTPTYLLEKSNNNIYIKREDLLPFSFGGNKARKAEKFFQEIDKGDYDTVVTYGSGASNHCRVVANMARARNMQVIIISPKEAYEETFNTQMVNLCEATTIVVPVGEVHETIENTLQRLKRDGKKPYFIYGGGHGLIGTYAYVDCFNEIQNFEDRGGIKFDYIFLASGTGATQAGLVCGKIINKSQVNVIGISIARKEQNGKQVIIDSVKEALGALGVEVKESIIQNEVTFIDKYICGGYGESNKQILDIIKNNYLMHGIPMDETYTGKAFYGMTQYLKEHNISSKNILFIHTGGTPLFFDYLRRQEK